MLTLAPQQLPDVEKFSKAENTKFFLTGVPNTERERVSFDLNQTCTWRAAISILVSAIGPPSNLTRPLPSPVIDVPSGMRVAVTYPRVNNVNGTMRPRLERSGVQRVRAIATFHRLASKDDKVVNLHTGALEKVTVLGGGAVTAGQVFVRPRIRIMTSSMIVAASGCGELLMAYPLTSVSTVPTAPEQMRMQLRVFLGAAVFKSEDVVICEDVKSEGVISGGGTKAAATADSYDPAVHDGFMMKKDTADKMGSMPAFTYGINAAGDGALAGNDDRSSLYKQEITDEIAGTSFKNYLGDQRAMDNDAETFPVVVYQGAVFDGTTNKMKEANTGHLGAWRSGRACFYPNAATNSNAPFTPHPTGILDDPKLCKRLSGQNLYSEAPQMVKIV
jgi:hypothetical protein